MIPSHDAKRGHRFLVKTGLKSFPEFEATYIKQKSNGQVVFDRNDRRERWYLECAEFIRMWQILGTIVRIDPPSEDSGFTLIPPAAFEPIDEHKDSKRVVARKKMYLKAVTQQWYVRLIDAEGLKSSIANFEDLIERKEGEHKSLGLAKTGYRASTLIMLCRTCGTRNDRPLDAFIDDPCGGDQRSGQWHEIVLQGKRNLLRRYYSAEAPSDEDVKSEFRAYLAKSAQKLPLESSGFKRPSKGTVSNWIARAATPDNIALREGRQVANRQAGGIHPVVPTQRPLECVVLDHTQIDMNIVVLDASGTIIERVVRPYLIIVIDVHTRMILAAKLSLEPPSLHTLYAGLKEALFPKAFVGVKAGGAYEWARDGYGKFFRMIVDNGLENIGRSMQMSAWAVGLHVSFAPVRTGEYKSIAERLFQMLNTRLWHLALGGVKTKPSEPRRFDPRDNAAFTLAQAQQTLWRYIIEHYHVSEHDALDLQPALTWKEAYNTWKRPLVADMRRIEKVFGRYATRDLTTSGVRFGSQFFHDATVVDELLADLYYLARKKRGPRGKHNTVSVQVEITYFDDDVSHIVVFNPVRQTHVVIPNRDFSASGSYEAQADIALELRQRRQEFFPEDQATINYDEIVSELAGRRPPGDSHSSVHSTPADKADRMITSRSGPRRNRKTKSTKAPKTPKIKVVNGLSKPSQQRVKIAEEQTSQDDAMGNVRSLVALTPTSDADVTDLAAFREKIRIEMRKAGKS
jgi:putative transposase